MQAQAATLRHIGRGGLDEEAAMQAGGDRAAGASDMGRELVSTVEIVRHPSEAEQVLRMLPGQLRGLKHLPQRAGELLLLHPTFQKYFDIWMCFLTYMSSERLQVWGNVLVRTA